MYIKKITVIIILLLSFIMNPPIVYGQVASSSPIPVPTSIPKSLAFKLDLLNKLLAFVQQHPNFVIRNNTVVTAINGTTVTVKKNGQVYKVHAANAIVVRRYWGQSSLDQVTVNDKLNIIGTWSDNTKTTIDAFLIRDISIQEHDDGFLGTMSGVPTLTFQTANKGTWSVGIAPQTQITDDNGAPITISAIKSLDTLRIEGLVDYANKTITATMIIDTSYASLSPTPSIAATIGG